MGFGKNFKKGVDKTMKICYIMGEEPGARSQEPGARSQEPGQEPGARSQEPGARSQEPGPKFCLFIGAYTY